MPAFLRRALALACFLLFGSPVWAGVYITTEKEPFPVPTALDKVKYHLGDLMMCLIAQNPGTKVPKDSLAEKLMERVKNELEPKHQRGELTLAERVDLSGCYIRLGKYEAARHLLNEVLDEGPNKVKDDAPELFLLRANLAASYFDGNNELLGRALLKQKEAINSAPEKPPLATWTAEQWTHYRIAEGYMLKLLEQRYAAAVRGKGGNWKTVDPLFDKVHFVGPSGEYDAGKIALDSLHELPRDALPIMVQLVYWCAGDSRLYWLYGEVLNAEGQVNDAYTVLNDLVDTRRLGLVADLKRHRLVLKEAYRVPKEEAPVVVPEEPKLADDKQPASRTKPTRDWRSLGTGFLAGMLVAAFGGLQVYIWRGAVAPRPFARRPRRPSPARRGRRASGPPTPAMWPRRATTRDDWRALPMSPEPDRPLVIGWKERVAFPEWHVRRVRAKIDTGACTSALDVASCDIEETPTGPVAHLRLAFHRGRPEKFKELRLPVVRFTVVRNSGGTTERRPVVEALMHLGPVEKRIRLTVTRRAGMRYRILLGRAALSGDFVVDVRKKFVCSI